MSSSSRVLAVIPARGGSKRLPRKNVLPLRGKPLIAWTIEAVIASGVATSTVVSSDDEEILSIATSYNVTGFKRSTDLATDTATSVDVVIEVINALEKMGERYDTVVLLQPTSPFREAADIVSAYQLFCKQIGSDSVASVCELEHPVQWCGRISDDGTLVGIDFQSNKRSQDHEKSFRLNGAVYVADVNLLKEKRTLFSNSVKAFVMDKDRSVDIDTEKDYMFCKMLCEIDFFESNLRNLDK